MSVSRHISVSMLAGISAIQPILAGTVSQIEVDADSVPENLTLKVGLLNSEILSSYASADLRIFETVFDELFELPAVQAAYASKAEFIASIGDASLLSPPGDVADGWSGSFDDHGTLALTHQPGVPGADYDEWTANEGSNLLYLEVSLPKSLLELDGQPGYDPAADAGVSVSQGLLSGAFVVRTTAGVTVVTASRYYRAEVPPVELVITGFESAGSSGGFFLSVRSDPPRSAEMIRVETIPELCDPEWTPHGTLPQTDTGVWEGTIPATGDTRAFFRAVLD